METTNYGFSKIVALPFAEAVTAVKAALAKEGFGQLTEIDVQAKLKEKVGMDMEPYLILGMCNPKLAYQALQIETEIGLLLPCNVIVYEKEGSVHVAAQKPSLMSQVVQKEALKAVADEAEKGLLAALEAVA
ncbi:MAG: hypothetical protein A3J06_01175 [Candidatus Moranbacteria bacterium RIFCSPLOWO2_02_FULL_48_19]|nr:MAG: hypothetical protein A3J06_01175 [Candidatus Moranbacteria bacterium RIFCSPLOWO2_02_FULL_48_19]OGI32016.1 MAG: hypothetical protein A3G09_03045 [Candidatus Moranbacteria bacterium RIFCSPLOWO2_12_FULL_48_12]